MSDLVNHYYTWIDGVTGLGSGSSVLVIGWVLTIAVADSLSDALEYIYLKSLKTNHIKLFGCLQ